MTQAAVDNAAQCLVWDGVTGASFAHRSNECVLTGSRLYHPGFWLSANHRRWKQTL